MHCLCHGEGKNQFVTNRSVIWSLTTFSYSLWPEDGAISSTWNHSVVVKQVVICLTSIFHYVLNYSYALMRFESRSGACTLKSNNSLSSHDIVRRKLILPQRHEGQRWEKSRGDESRCLLVQKGRFLCTHWFN